MSETRHPRDHINCPECGAQPRLWTTHRTLPQIGQTYICGSCGREVYVYDAGDGHQQRRQWRPVTDGMAVNLLFFDEVGGWPDSELDGLFRQGVERMAAIDYYMVDREGLTQTEWADRTGRDQSTVSENVSTGRETLSD